MDNGLIRNFAIIAHIDPGKSTLADRLIQRCGGLSDREMQEQVLDSMDLEKERGITIKAQTAALRYTARDGQVYKLNLIDTPGHVHFPSEVFRSPAACRAALPLGDGMSGGEGRRGGVGGARAAARRVRAPGHRARAAAGGEVRKLDPRPGFAILLRGAVDGAAQRPQPSRRAAAGAEGGNT